MNSRNSKQAFALCNIHTLCASLLNSLFTHLHSHTHHHTNAEILNIYIFRSKKVPQSVSAWNAFGNIYTVSVISNDTYLYIYSIEKSLIRNYMYIYLETHTHCTTLKRISLFRWKIRCAIAILSIYPKYWFVCFFNHMRNLVRKCFNTNKS